VRCDTFYDLLGLRGSTSKHVPNRRAAIGSQDSRNKLRQAADDFRGQCGADGSFSKVSVAQFRIRCLLTASGMVFSAQSRFVANPGTQANVQLAQIQTQGGAVIQLNLVGANPRPVAVGEDQRPGPVNYFIGRDRSKWHTRVPTYGKVQSKDVYPGIDLAYYWDPSQLEYDFEVAVGANPRQIQFDVKGADSVSVDASGDLILRTEQGALHIKSPVLYQTFNGMKLLISGGFSLKRSTRVGSSLTGYDRNKPLVIDPVLLYSTYLCGLADDQAIGLAVDSEGSAYVAGWQRRTPAAVTAAGFWSSGHWTDQNWPLNDMTMLGQQSA
jgi:hypothetical protein